MALLTKSDLTSYVQFTNNIPDRLFEFHRDKAETLDFKPRIPIELWDKLNEVSPGSGAELTDFFTDYIKPILAHFFILRYLVEAGRNLTQFGLVVPAEPTSQQASDQNRAEVRNSYKRDLDAYLNLFYARLKEVSYTFDNTAYDFANDACKDSGRSSVISIHAV